VQYEIVAEAYRDLEQATGRLALIDRLAALLARTPTELLPTVCYPCQGLIAPEFAGVDLGLAEKLAVRAVASAAGASLERVVASVRETGLGQAAEQLLGGRRRRPARPPAGHRRGRHPASDRAGSRRRLAGAQAGPARPPAGRRHPAGGPLPAAPGHRLASAWRRHPDHLGRARAGARGRPRRPTGAGTRLQHLLRPRAGRRHGGTRRPAGGRAVARAPRQPGARHARPAGVGLGGDPRQTRRPMRGGVQVRRRAGPGPPQRRWPDRAVHPGAGAGQQPVS